MSMPQRWMQQEKALVWSVLLVLILATPGWGQRFKTQTLHDSIGPQSSQSGRYPQSSSSSKSPNLNWLPGLIQGLDQAVRNSQQSQQPTRRPYYPPHYHNEQYYPQPRYQAPAPVPPPAQTRPNTPPPEKVLSTQPNAQPDVGIELLDTATTQAARDAVEKKANETLDQLDEALGDAADDPKVKDILDEGRDRLAQGKPLDEAWADRLREAATATDNLPADIDTDQLDGLVKEGIDLSGALAVLDKASDTQGTQPGLPTGSTQCVTMPVWPAGETFLLPDGSLVMGTGGDGGVQVVNTDGAELLGIAVGVGDPEPESSTDFAKRVKSGVYLMNPRENGVAVGYVIANNNYTMEPGYTQRLAEGQTWEIRFDRGQEFGEGRYTLSDGTYAFGPSDHGWELFRQSFALTIDNSANENTFNYNVDNEQFQVAPGQTRTHNSSYPILVRFDRGNGKTAQKQVRQPKHTLQVAINPHDQLWELYPLDKSRRTASASGKRDAAGRAARLQALLKLSEL